MSLSGRFTVELNPGELYCTGLGGRWLGSCILDGRRWFQFQSHRLYMYIYISTLSSFCRTRKGSVILSIYLMQPVYYLLIGIVSLLCVSRLVSCGIFC